MVYATDYENSAPGLGHLINAPTGRCLFIPESMADKIEQKSSKRDMEESMATKYAEEMNRPKQEVLDEQQKLIEEGNRNKEQKELEEELKKAGVPHEEVNKHLEELKRCQEKHVQSKEKKGTEDRSSSRQPGGDPNCHRQIYQSQGRQESRDHQKKHDELHFNESHFDKHSQSSHFSASGTSVDMQQEKPLADTGCGPGQDIAMGTMVQLPNTTGSGTGIYGVVRWIGFMPKVTGQVAGIELVSYTCIFTCYSRRQNKVPIVYRLTTDL